jgi:hypothetical protein
LNPKHSRNEKERETNSEVLIYCFHVLPGENATKINTIKGTSAHKAIQNPIKPHSFWYSPQYHLK